MSVKPKAESVEFSDLEVRKLAYLARLELTEQELSELSPQLGQIIEFVKTLSELDTEGVEPMTTALDVDNRWREDQLVDGLSSEEAVSNSPVTDGECFLVPAVLGTSGAKN